MLCPICGNKTRTRILKNTELVNFPLFCPKCRNETIVNVKHGILKAIKEPDAKTQSQ
ncbi:cysteine-rich KTR domain-containing protein [uncultured Methanobrevibacter sp.]|uniref:cysteine-rich KTR domain-containing protein n=1 Tax=uncultured Methanobrevibacter sp. TaxID=253161 RepID=UPI0031838580